MIFAANLKCNHTRTSFALYARALNDFLGSKDGDVFIFPPSVAFLQDELFFTQGAQNFYPCINGAFTGELGKEHLDEFGIDCVLLGHSERRVFENHALIKEKFDFAKAQGWRIFLCVGENLQTKEAGRSREFLQDQLCDLDLSYAKLTIAYEPIYSIGTGLSADLGDIAEVLSFLSSLSGAPLLYGGSVNENNAEKILQIPHCSGVLIGSSALRVENFIAMLEKIRRKI